MSTQNKISFYESARDKNPSKAITIKEFVGMVHDGLTADSVSRVRGARSEDDKKTAKMKLPAVSLSGCVTQGGRAKAMEEKRFLHSGFVQLDIDGGGLNGKTPEQAKAMLAADPHVLSAFISPSGQGAKALFKISPCATIAEHKTAFLAVENYVLQTHGLAIDQSTKDASRLCYIPSDAECTWSDSPVEFVAPIPAPTPKGKANSFPAVPWEGINEWTLRACRWCEIHGMTEDETRIKIESCDDGSMRRHLTQEEVERSIRKVFDNVSTPDRKKMMDGINVFYDGVRYLFDNGRDYVPMDSRSIAKQLEIRGISPASDYVAMIQTDHFIKYAGPLAGKKRGLHEYNGDHLLATVNPKIIQSMPGDYPTIKKFIADLLGCDGHNKDQIGAFLGWLHTARKAMLSGARRPGQALVVAGPVACGKTQLIKQIIVPAMGGRDARPYKYLSGANTFNQDLIGAEVLIIDDETAATRIEKRRALGDGIKNALFASSVRIEGKFKNAFDFDPLWRLVIAVNDEPESLLVLPPLSADLADKLIVLKCWKALEMDDVEFQKWQKAIRDELPAFLHAVENFKIPDDRIDGRCGVKSFYHPEVVSAISELSPEHQLRNLIEVAEHSGGICLPWTGTAAQLRSLIMSCPATRNDAGDLLGSHAVNCGRYLGRMIGKGVEKRGIIDDNQIWKITRRGEIGR